MKSTGGTQVKKLKIAVAIAALVALGGSAMAYVAPADPVEIDVYATMDQTLQITITGATVYDLGNFTSNQQKVTTGAYVIKNTGAGMTQSYRLTVNNVYGGWSLQSGVGMPGADLVAVDAVFNTAAPLIADFADTTDRLSMTPGYKVATGTDMAGTQTGINSPLNDSRNLWLRVTAPLTSSTTNKNQIVVEVDATTP
jgi:hypothetical protein